MNKTNWNHIDSLAKKAILGDQQSYREFLESVQDYVQIKINRIIPASGRDDVLQETLLAVHKSLKTLDIERSCKSWLNAIVHYKVSDFLRDFYKNSSIGQEVQELPSFDTDHVELKQYITHITSILSDKERQILLKLKYEGYSISDVAKEVALDESNVKIISFRAIRKIHAYIIDEEFNER